MEWKECDGKVWNVMECPEWCRNDGGASEMDLAKFYVTIIILMLIYMSKDKIISLYLIHIRLNIIQQSEN